MCICNLWRNYVDTDVIIANKMIRFGNVAVVFENERSAKQSSQSTLVELGA